MTPDNPAWPERVKASETLAAWEQAKKCVLKEFPELNRLREAQNRTSLA